MRSEEPDNRVTEQASKRATEEEKSSTLNAPLEITADLEALPKVVEAMQSRIPENAIISLQGDLAAGKTTLVQAIARSLGNESAVTSPTFSLQHPYGEGLYHYDLYRVGFEELGQLGMIEEFEKPGWHLVEWMDDRLKAFLAAAGYNLWQVAITPEGDRRIYRIEPLNA